MDKKITIMHIRNMIIANRLEYVTLKAIENRDYNKLSLIFAIATDNAYDYNIIWHYVNEYHNNEE